MLRVFVFFCLILTTLFCASAAQSTEQVIALSSDSASALAVGAFIVGMIFFGIVSMLRIQITDSIGDCSEK